MKLVWLFCLVCTIAMASCGSPESVVPKLSFQELEKKRKLLTQIKEGMSEQDVLDILGQPDEVRVTEQDPHYEGEAYRWAYGIQAKGAFAAVSLVVFNKNKKVTFPMPSVDSWLSLGEIMDAPLSEKAISTPSAMSCELREVETGSHGFPKVRVTLANKGKETFRFRHDHTAIRRNLVEELYDSRKVLLYRRHNLRSHSPSSPHLQEWPVLVIPPGGKEVEEFDIYISDDFGPLVPGTYYIRVAFPFEVGKFYPSNLVKFEYAPMDTSNEDAKTK